MKSDQEIKRARSRRENLSRAEEHESNGNLSAAHECYQKAVDISPSVAYGLIQVLKQENVSYIVAPYEADAQMTFLALSKHVEAVITEDSDLIAFGFTQMMLLEMCILSGCDYLPSLPGMGLKKAHALMKKFKSHENVIKHLKYNSVEVTPLYEESFKKALLTFKHQRVYDPVSEDIVHLSEPADIAIEDLDFLGFASLEQRENSKLLELLPSIQMRAIKLPVLALMHKSLSELQVESIISYTTMFKTSVGTCDDRGVAGCTEVKPFTIVQNSVCKPCISFHKDLDSDQKNGKVMSVNENGIVRSPYFLKKSREEIGKENSYDVNKNGDNKMNNVFSSHLHEPMYALNEKTCRKDKKIVTLQSSCFRENIRESANCEIGKTLEQYSVQTHRLDLDAVDCTTTVDSRKNRARSSYFKKFLHGSLSSDNPLECTMKKRKIAQTDSPTKDANDNNHTSGTSTSDLDEDTRVEEGKFGCNISHLGRYSNIAEKSMEKFVSVISSFRYNSSGSRASGLRAPLKDIKNNCIKSSTVDMDLRKFAYAPTKQTTALRCHKTKV
ncbi:Exonuclease 1 [Sesamum angolense]|uniref:Exonuclease 1 n=1 Tax=Sesamum angolense TaxID=2727404 RepID=A0AAE1WU31_9LAMI|nr:Exonuclease 1 [Sesamum angolense]